MWAIQQFLSLPPDTPYKEQCLIYVPFICRMCACCRSEAYGLDLLRAYCRGRGKCVMDFWDQVRSSVKHASTSMAGVRTYKYNASVHTSGSTAPVKPVHSNGRWRTGPLACPCTS